MANILEAIAPIGYDEILQQSVAVWERVQITGHKLRPVHGNQFYQQN